jgi:hypothetical protein
MMKNQRSLFARMAAVAALTLCTVAGMSPMCATAEDVADEEYSSVTMVDVAGGSLDISREDDDFVGLSFDDDVVMPDVADPAVSCAGCGLVADISQVGDGNIAFVRQSGERNRVGLRQVGDRNSADLAQRGLDNRLDVRQHGNGLSLAIRQRGMGAAVSVTQRN